MWHRSAIMPVVSQTGQGWLPWAGPDWDGVKSVVTVRYLIRKTLWLTIKAVVENREHGFEHGWLTKNWLSRDLPVGSGEQFDLLCLFFGFCHLILVFYSIPLFSCIKLPLSRPMSFLAFTLPVFSTHLAGDGSGRAVVCTAAAWDKITTYV